MMKTGHRQLKELAQDYITGKKKKKARNQIQVLWLLSPYPLHFIAHKHKHIHSQTENTI